MNNDYAANFTAGSHRLELEGRERLTITGVDRLVGARVNATDLRAGAAMVIAGLMSEGTTEIGGIEYILRGYEHIDQKLIQLGAHIERVRSESSF